MKYLKFLLYALLIVSAVVIVAAYATGFTDAMVTAILNWAYVLCAVTVVCIIVMPIFFRAGKTSKNTIIGIAAFVIACVVSYLCASSDPLQLQIKKEYTEATMKWVDAGLILTVILLAGVILSILSAVVTNVIKK